MLSAQNGGTLLLDTSVTNIGSGQILAADKSAVVQNGVTITGGTINSSGSGSLQPTRSGANFLSGVTVAGLVDLQPQNGAERVINGLTVNGTISVDASSGGILGFGASTSSSIQNIAVGGTPRDIHFGTTSGGSHISLDSNVAVTFGAALTVDGAVGTIGTSDFDSTGVKTITNNGTISADVAGGTITVEPATGTNNNILSAENGGTLALVGNLTNGAAGQIDAGNASAVLQNNLTITGGTINSSGSGSLQPNRSASNFLSNVTVAGLVDLKPGSNGEERVINSLTVNGTINVDAVSGGILGFAHSGGDNREHHSSMAAALIVFRPHQRRQQISLDGGVAVTFGASSSGNLLIHGTTGLIGTSANDSTGGKTIINNATIVADAGEHDHPLEPAGGTTNASTLSAQNGGTLLLDTSVTNIGSGQILADDKSAVVQNGVTITGGTINSSGSGSLQPTRSANNFLSNVTVAGLVDLKPQNGEERVINGLTVNGTAINVDASQRRILELRRWRRQHQSEALPCRWHAAIHESWAPRAAAIRSRWTAASPSPSAPPRVPASSSTALSAPTAPPPRTPPASRPSLTTPPFPPMFPATPSPSVFPSSPTMESSTWPPAARST